MQQVARTVEGLLEVRGRDSHEIFATLYHNLGIPAEQLTLPDLVGRPQHLVANAAPIRELI